MKLLRKASWRSTDQHRRIAEFQQHCFTCSDAFSALIAVEEILLIVKLIAVIASSQHSFSQISIELYCSIHSQG